MKIKICQIILVIILIIFSISLFAEETKDNAKKETTKTEKTDSSSNPNDKSEEIKQAFTKPEVNTETIGIGLYLGMPTGILAQFGRTGSTLRGIVGWSVQHELIEFALDYTYVLENMIPSIPPMGLYIGIGAGIVIIGDKGWHDEDGSVGFGVRVPVGAKYMFKEYPVDLFIEAVPGISIVPGIHFGIGAGIGASYFF